MKARFLKNNFYKAYLLKVSSGLFIGLTRMAEEVLEELEINPDILRENATKDYAASTTSRPTTTTVENTSSTLPPTTASTASTTITTTEKLGFWFLHTFRAYSLKKILKCHENMGFRKMSWLWGFFFSFFRVLPHTIFTNQWFCKISPTSRFWPLWPFWHWK